MLSAAARTDTDHIRFAKEGDMKFISVSSVAQALKERKFWSFCAALTTDMPLCVGPHLRML
jgi:hypothetical protein